MTNTENNNLSNIDCIIFDFDGVFTNNKVIVSETGIESVVCNRSDGLGLAMIHSIGIKTLILSTEKNRVVSTRANKLNIECIQGVDNKYAELVRLSQDWEIPLANIAFVGNDINDLECMEVVGFPVAVADAYPPVIDVATIILTRKGGEGAVREICEMIIKVRDGNKWKR